MPDKGGPGFRISEVILIRTALTFSAAACHCRQMPHVLFPLFTISPFQLEAQSEGTEVLVVGLLSGSDWYGLVFRVLCWKTRVSGPKESPKLRLQKSLFRVDQGDAL